jgi:phage gp36-like protein
MTQQLATIADFANFGGPSPAFAMLSPTQQNAELVAASADVIDRISERYTPPYIAWGTNITRAVCIFAVWNMLSARGFDPTSPSDVSARTRYLDTEKFLERVNSGDIVLNDLIDATPGNVDDEAQGGSSSDTGRFGDPSIDPTVVP